MRICDIKCGRRHRQQLGNIDALAQSIATVGLLHPPVVDPAGNLIAGRRRLEALVKLGRLETDVTIVRTAGDALKALLAERDENTCRLDFTPTEAVRLANAITEHERAAAKDRQREHGGTRPGMAAADEHSGAIPQSVPQRAMDRVAAAVGLSRKTLAKATAVVDAAAKDPDRFGDLPARMDRTAKVDPAYRELKARAATTTDDPALKALARATRDLRARMAAVNAVGGVVKLAHHWKDSDRRRLAGDLRAASVELRACAEQLDPRS